MQAVLIGAILLSEMGTIDSAYAQLSQINDDSGSDQKNSPSLESLKKRSPVTRWKSLKGSSKPDLWKSVPSTAEKTPDYLSKDQPVFEEPKPMLLDQRRTNTPQNTSAKSNGKSTKDQPLPVFNLTNDPVRKQETFNFPDKLQKPKVTSSSELRVNEDPLTPPDLSPFDSSSDPTASQFLPPIIRLDPTIRGDARIEEIYSLPSQTTQSAETPRKRSRGYMPAPLQRITEISPFADYVPKGYETDDETKIPETELLDQTPYRKRNFDELVYTWEPTNLSYNPLYFEDAPLERYGHTHHPLLQPFVSATRFGVQLVGLPYQMTIDPIYKKRYPLGYYRPGEYAPKKLYQIPFNLDAAIVEGAAVTGMFFLIP